MHTASDGVRNAQSHTNVVYYISANCCQSLILTSEVLMFTGTLEVQKREESAAQHT